MIVRKMEQRDLPAVVELGKYVHEHSVFKECEFSEQRLSQNLMFTLSSPACVPVVVYEEEKIVGYMIASMAPNFFGTETVVTVVAWYVHQEFRSKGVGEALISFIVSFAELCKIVEIRIEGPVEIGGFMKRAGFDVTGTNFMLRRK